MGHLQSSSDLFIMMAASVSLSEFLERFDEYWTKRTEERNRTSGAKPPGRKASDAPGDPASLGVASGRRQEGQDGRRGKKS